MITLYNTAIGSFNLGDQIIMEAVKEQLEEIFIEDTFINYATHYPMSKYAANKANTNKLAFVGGTNLLQAHWDTKPKNNQWMIGFFESFFMSPVVLMGCGWSAYSNRTTYKAKKLYKNILSQQSLHSVRDDYTEKQLRHLGIKNVVNTACPTMWKMNEDFLCEVRTKKSDSVVFTLTDYNKNYELDTKLINLLSNYYSQIYFWPQGSGDLEYLKELEQNFPSVKLDNINILCHNLRSYDNVLKNIEIDFIGTRLHAGIRAIQFKQRSIIIGIDNRAYEMGKDFKLNVIDRNNLDCLESYMKNNLKVEISIPLDNINIWKSQFKK